MLVITLFLLQLKGQGPSIPNMPGIFVTCDGGREERTGSELVALIEEVCGILGA